MKPNPRKTGRIGRPFLLALLGLCMAAAPATAQLVQSGVLAIPRGQSQLLVQPQPVERVSIGDPDIADAVVVTPQEVLVNARSLGTTTLIIWDANNTPRTYTIEVTVDVAALERTLQALFPGEQIAATAVGNTVILAGTATSMLISRQAVEVARSTGAVVVDNIFVQAPQQVLLQVRIAEVSKGALRELGSEISAFNPQNLEGTGDWSVETVSEGLMRLLLIDPRASLDVVLRALRTTTEFRSLAEPNLLAMDGAEASFLAGGEFPFPVAQPGATNGAVTIEWREFGVRLNFTPTLTGAGTIRLAVEPEVSELDFGGGLVISGFAIPTVLVRRAETQVELEDGQTFAIAGLLDHTTSESVTRLPILGELPIIGAFFRSRVRRQDATELLVLVTPRLVGPSPVPPPVPTGEPQQWRLDSQLRPVPRHPMPYTQPLPPAAPQPGTQP